MASTEKKATCTVKEKDLLQWEKITITSADREIVEQVVKLMPIKVDLEVIFPPGAEADDGPAAAKPVLDRYATLIGKQATVSFTAVAEGYRKDQAGQKDGFSNADSALDKFNKYVEKLMEDFRIDLREAIAKKLGLKAKELMTVGRVSPKESKLIPGSFHGETAVDKRDDADDGDLGAALKFKKWQYVGLASSNNAAKIITRRKKEVTKSELKEMEELFEKEERAGLKFSRGRVQAESETNLEFEFLKKSKVGKDPRTYTQRLKLGLREQLERNVHLTITPVDEFTMDAKPTATKSSSFTSTGKSSTTTTTTTN